MTPKKKIIKKRILIVGSDGYLGTVLSKFLSKKKIYNTKCLDTGYFRDGVIGKEKTSDLNIDIRKFNLNYIKNFDVVIFLAANSNDPAGNVNKTKFYQITRLYTYKVAKKCKEYGVKFIFPSSCSVYGFGKKTFNEKSNTNPLTGYSRNKLHVEKDLSKLADKNFSPIALRFSTIFGYSGRIRFDLVINMLCLLAIVKKKIILNSNGLAWRPHLDINDACKAFFLCIEKDISNGKLNVFNVGFQKNNLQILTISKIIKKLTGSKIELNFYDKESLISDRKINNGVDKRSYKVNFSRFHRLFPSFKNNVSITKQINILINQLKQKKVNKSVMNNIKFYRLQKMEYLLKKKLLDKNLYWRK
tara:strand:+ start:3358 stop:4434 length:1077 start_codon:yes stop_codon:yes gene_type:complete